jgi:hypothetical protein
MKKEFEISKITRNNILKAVQNLSDEQLIKIPQGYNNNILWNMGHVVGSGQKLTYGMAGMPMRVSEDFPVSLLLLQKDLLLRNGNQHRTLNK